MFIDAIKARFGRRQSALTATLEPAVVEQLKAALAKLCQPVELVVSLDDSAKAREMCALLDEVGALSALLSIRHDGDATRRPSFVVARPGEPARIVFAGIPTGKELASLVLALLHTGGHPPRVEAALVERIRAIPGTLHFETYITLSCRHCPDVVQALNTLAALNPGIRHTMVDGNLFLAEIKQHDIKAVPTIYLNGEPFDRGRKTIEEILDRLAAGAAAATTHAV